MRKEKLPKLVAISTFPFSFCFLTKAYIFSLISAYFRSLKELAAESKGVKAVLVKLFELVL